MFVRSDEYISKIFMDALQRQVHQDATIRIQPLGKKLKAYCVDTDTYVQFPRDIREQYVEFKADVILASNKSGTEFYRAYKGSIRPVVGGRELGVIA